MQKLIAELEGCLENICQLLQGAIASKNQEAQMNFFNEEPHRIYYLAKQIFEQFSVGEYLGAEMPFKLFDELIWIEWFFWYILWNFLLCTIVIEALTPLNRAVHTEYSPWLLAIEIQCSCQFQK